MGSAILRDGPHPTFPLSTELREPVTAAWDRYARRGALPGERERTQERIREIKADQKRHQTFLGGSRPFGYTVTADGTLEAEPAEQRAIRRMLTLKAKGHSLRAIAAAIQQRDGLRISHMAVQRILTEAASPAQPQRPRVYRRRRHHPKPESS